MFFGCIETERLNDKLRQDSRIQRLRQVRQQEKTISLSNCSTFRTLKKNQIEQKINHAKDIAYLKKTDELRKLSVELTDGLINSGYSHFAAKECDKKMKLRNAHTIQISREKMLREKSRIDEAQHAIRLENHAKQREVERRKELIVSKKDYLISTREDAKMEAERRSAFLNKAKLLLFPPQNLDKGLTARQCAESIQLRGPCVIRAHITKHGNQGVDRAVIYNVVAEEEDNTMRRMWKRVMIELITMKKTKIREREAKIEVSNEKKAAYLVNELAFLQSADRGFRRLERARNADMVPASREDPVLLLEFERDFLAALFPSQQVGETDEIAARKRTDPMETMWDSFSTPNLGHPKAKGASKLQEYLINNSQGPIVDSSADGNMKPPERLANPPRTVRLTGSEQENAFEFSYSDRLKSRVWSGKAGAKEKAGEIDDHIKNSHNVGVRNEFSSTQSNLPVLQPSTFPRSRSSSIRSSESSRSSRSDQHVESSPHTHTSYDDCKPHQPSNRKRQENVSYYRCDYEHFGVPIASLDLREASGTEERFTWTAQAVARSATDNVNTSEATRTECSAPVSSLQGGPHEIQKTRMESSARVKVPAPLVSDSFCTLSRAVENRMSMDVTCATSIANLHHDSMDSSSSVRSAAPYSPALSALSSSHGDIPAPMISQHRLEDELRGNVERPSFGPMSSAHDGIRVFHLDMLQSESTHSLPSSSHRTSQPVPSTPSVSSSASLCEDRHHIFSPPFMGPLSTQTVMPCSTMSRSLSPGPGTGLGHSLFHGHTGDMSMSGMQFTGEGQHFSPEQVTTDADGRRLEKEMSLSQYSTNESQSQRGGHNRDTPSQTQERPRALRDTLLTDSSNLSWDNEQKRGTGTAVSSPSSYELAATAYSSYTQSSSSSASPSLSSLHSSQKISTSKSTSRPTPGSTSSSLSISSFSSLAHPMQRANTPAPPVRASEESSLTDHHNQNEDDGTSDSIHSNSDDHLEASAAANSMTMRRELAAMRDGVLSQFTEASGGGRLFSSNLSLGSLMSSSSTHSRSTSSLHNESTNQATLTASNLKTARGHSERSISISLPSSDTTASIVSVDSTSRNSSLASISETFGRSISETQSTKNLPGNHQRIQNLLSDEVSLSQQWSFADSTRLSSSLGYYDENPDGRVKSQDVGRASLSSSVSSSSLSLAEQSLESIVNPFGLLSATRRLEVPSSSASLHTPDLSLRSQSLSIGHALQRSPWTGVSSSRTESSVLGSDGLDLLSQSSLDSIDVVHMDAPQFQRTVFSARI